MCYGTVRVLMRSRVPLRCSPQERHWESNWTIDAIWEVVYLKVLVAVCILLRPSMNTQRCEWATDRTQMLPSFCSSDRPLSCRMVLRWQRWHRRQQYYCNVLRSPFHAPVFVCWYNVGFPTPPCLPSGARATKTGAISCCSLSTTTTPSMVAAWKRCGAFSLFLLPVWLVLIEAVYLCVHLLARRKGCARCPALV